MLPASANHDRFLPHDGARLRYRDEGAGAPLVLVHGWTLDLTAWDGVQAGLAGRLRVVRLDRRGCGASTGTPNPAEDAGDVLALLDALRIPQAALLGMSQGARVALDVALRAPERVCALILDGAPALEGLPGGPWPQELPLDRYRAILAEKGPDALRVELAAHPLLQLRTRNAKTAQARSAMLARYAGADLQTPAAESPFRPMDFTQLRMPVLVLNGEHDTAQRLAVGAALARAIPGCRRQIIADTGHLACLDAPRRYGRLVADFLSQACDFSSRIDPMEIS